MKRGRHRPTPSGVVSESWKSRASTDASMPRATAAAPTAAVWLTSEVSSSALLRACGVSARCCGAPLALRRRGGGCDAAPAATVAIGAVQGELEAIEGLD